MTFRIALSAGCELSRVAGGNGATSPCTAARRRDHQYEKFITCRRLSSQGNPTRKRRAVSARDIASWPQMFLLLKALRSHSISFIVSVRRDPPSCACKNGKVGRPVFVGENSYSIRCPLSQITNVNKLCNSTVHGISVRRDHLKKRCAPLQLNRSIKFP